MEKSGERRGGGVGGVGGIINPNQYCRGHIWPILVKKFLIDTAWCGNVGLRMHYRGVISMLWLVLVFYGCVLILLVGN